MDYEFLFVRQLQQNRRMGCRVWFATRPFAFFLRAGADTLFAFGPGNPFGKGLRGFLACGDVVTRFQQHTSRAAHHREGILFDARGSSGRPIYHTNVMMGLGDRFAVICPDAIPDAAQRARVMQSLAGSFDVIEISVAQMEKHFCGNLLQLRNRSGEPLIVMSARAEKGFTPEQRRRLTAYGKVVSVDLETIETIGGGSARCMLAEVFLPRASSRHTPKFFSPRPLGEGKGEGGCEKQTVLMLGWEPYSHASTRRCGAAVQPPPQPVDRLATCPTAAGFFRRPFIASTYLRQIEAA